VPKQTVDDNTMLLYYTDVMKVSYETCFDGQTVDNATSLERNPITILRIILLYKLLSEMLFGRLNTRSFLRTVRI